MKLEEVLQAIPEAERAGVLAELRNAKSADDVAAVAQRYDVEIDAEAMYKKYAVTGTQELDDDDLENVAGGVEWEHAACSSTCTTASCF